MGGTGITSPFDGGNTEFQGGEIGGAPIASPFDFAPSGEKRSLHLTNDHCI